MIGRCLSWALVLALAGACSVSVARAEAVQKPANQFQNGAVDAKPAQVAREVFQSQDFWWKRTRQLDAPGLSGSWLQAVGSWLKPVLEAIGNFLAWLWELITGLFPRPVGDWSSGIPFLWLVALILTGWAAWKIGPRIWTWWRTRNSVADLRQETPAQEKLPQAEVLLERAGTAIQAGQYSEALRFTLLGLLAWLQQRGTLRYDPSRTNREYQQDLKKEPDLAAVFGQVARSFEQVWYGHYPAHQPDAQRVLSLCRRLVAGRELAA